MSEIETPSPTQVAQATATANSGGEHPPYSEPECAAGGTCGGEGVVIALDPKHPELDAAFGIEDPLSLPASDEVIPIIFDDALITEEGVLDCFARHYPGRAGVLLGMMANGYQLQFIDAMAQLPELRTRVNYSREELDRLSLARAENQEMLNRPYEFPAEMDNKVSLEQHFVEQRMLEMASQEENTQREIGALGEWRIEGKAIRITNIIDPAYSSGWSMFTDSTYGIDNDWEWLPTNRQGAARLNALIGHFMATNGLVIHGENGQVIDAGRENPRARTKRWLVGTGLVIVGAAEIVGGVFAATHTVGAGAVAGYALTVTGFDAYSQGLQTLFSPIPNVGRAGVIGDAFYAIGGAIGGDDLAMKFENIWSLGSVAVGIGAGAVVSLRYAGRTATSVGRAQVGEIRPLTGQLDTAKLATVEIKGMKFADDITGDLTSLPSSRGWVMNANGRKMWIPSVDSELRVLLRTRHWGNARFIDELGAAGRLRGPFKVVDEASARELLNYVSRNCGFKLDDVVDVVVVYNGTKPAFMVRNGLRAIRLPTALSESSKFTQFMYAAHELNHARVFGKLVDRYGFQRAYDIWRTGTTNAATYAREEVLVQRAAEFQMRTHFSNTVNSAEIEDLASALSDSARLIETYKKRM